MANLNSNKRDFGKTGDKKYVRPRPEVKPLNECTEAELISEGSRPNFARNISFAKTRNERAQLKRVKCAHKQTTPGMPRSKNLGIPALLIVHVTNKKKLKDFKTTHSFTVRRGEIQQVLNTFFYPNDEKVAQEDRAVVTKCFYNGRPYSIK